MLTQLTKISDLTPSTIDDVLSRAFDYKRKFDLGVRKENVLNGKMVAMVFEKPSLRTKVAFEIATEYLGGTAVYLTNAQILASGNNEKGRESIPDIARNLERFSDLIMARVFSHTTIADIVKHVRKPVINALCDLHHPTQALADLMTIRWHKPTDGPLKIAYVGDGNNVATSLMQICLAVGYDFYHAGPEGFEIPAAEVEASTSRNGAKAHLVRNAYEAVKDADVVYTDTFVSMGQEEEKAERLATFADYRVDLPLFEAAKSDAIFMHCLPAHRDEEVTDEVMDHARSVVFDQAECRMHIAKALLASMLGEGHGAHSSF